MRAYGVDPVVTGERWVALRRGQLLETRSCAMDHGHGDDAVEGDYRSGRDAVQEFVQSEDLPPVGVLGAGRLVVHGGDRRLQLIGAERRAGQRLGDQADPSAMAWGPKGCGPAPRTVPGRRLGGSAPGAGVGQQHQGKQPGDLVVFGQAFVKLPGQADGLGGELDAM